MRATGPLPLPGHLTPALLSCLLSNFLRCPAPPAPTAPPPDRETPCSLFLSGSGTTLYNVCRTKTSGEYLCHSPCKIIAKLPPFTNCSISAPSPSAASSLLLQPFHPSPSAAITPNYPAPSTCHIACNMPTYFVRDPPSPAKGGKEFPSLHVSTGEH